MAQSKNNTKANKPAKDASPAGLPGEDKRVFPFMRWKWGFMAVSIVVVGLSIYYMAVNGFNFGVDFKGGVKLVYQFTQPIGEGDIRSILESKDLGEVQVVRFGRDQEKSFLVKVKFQEGRNLAAEITKGLEDKWGAGSVKMLSEETVGPKVGAELRRRGWLAMILTWILILIYVGFRFDFLFAPGGIVALVHDTIVTLGFFTFFHKEFNLPILAAILTLIGYSINDTIIIYDRIRENLRKYPTTMPMEEVIDRSVSQTLSRTLITSLTVLFVSLVLFVFGGGVIHDFAFCMVVGVIVGSYSTIFIASPVYLGLHRLFPHKGLARGSHRVARK